MKYVTHVSAIMVLIYLLVVAILVFTQTTEEFEAPEKEPMKSEGHKI